MITLGLGKAIQDPAGSSTAVLQAITETATWCLSRSLRGDHLRSDELDPSAFLRMPPFDEFRIEEWMKRRRESYRIAVNAINERRSALLRDSNIEIMNSSVAQSKGRLLLYETLETVVDEAAKGSSHGFFDGEDAPPWDTWFLYSKDTIFCWVPESWVRDAQAGIEANPVDCIHWCDWSRL